MKKKKKKKKKSGREEKTKGREKEKECVSIGESAVTFFVLVCCNFFRPNQTKKNRKEKKTEAKTTPAGGKNYFYRVFLF